MELPAAREVWCRMRQQQASSPASGEPGGLGALGCVVEEDEQEPGPLEHQPEPSPEHAAPLGHEGRHSSPITSHSL